MSNIGTVSYTIGGCAFLVLSTLLTTSWRGRFQGGVVVAAACMSSIWCFWLAYQAGIGQPFTSVTFFLEVLRGGAWLSVLVTLLRGDEHTQTVSRLVVYAVHALWLLALAYGVSIVFRFPGDFPLWIVALLAIAVVGLVLLEQLYRNTRPEKRWALKFLILAIGGIFVYDFFLYSQALLLRGIEPQLWNARGAVNALAVPLIAVAATRNPDWSVGVFVSRRVVFYATALLGAGVYLLAMAAGGYYIQVHGGTWGAFAEIVFLGGAVLILAVIMLSAELRAKLRALLVNHFYKGKYEYRVEWLRLIQTLATPDQANPLGDRALQALAQIVECPGGSLWLRHERGEFRPLARWGMDLPREVSESGDGPLPRFLEQREWVIDLGQWRREPMRYDNLVLPEWLASQTRAWLVVPLMQEDQLVGFAVLMRSLASGEVTWEDTDLLKTVGRQVASYLAYQQAAQALARARQFDAYNRLTAFIMHDLKNLIAQQSLVVKNAVRHKHNPAFIEDVIRTVDNSVTRMNQLLDQLRRGELEQRPRRVALPELLTEVVARQSFMQPAPRLQVGADAVEVLADSQGLAAILGHIVRNAQEATPSDGRVHVRLSREGANAVIEVEDTGVGMEPAFLAERLFRPFDSTKGSKGMGIGAYQAREFVHASGGNVEVTSTPGKGTSFRIVLPILGPESVDQPITATESRL
jgi:putative PEP-CTERM system histidine kinase